MSHNDNSKRSVTQHISEDFSNYEFSSERLSDVNGFRPPPIPGGLFPPSQPSPPPYKPQPDAFNSNYGPQGAPPKYVPAKNDKGVQTFGNQSGSLKSVSPTSIKVCLYKYTYIWETSGRSYWSFLINIDRTSVSGFRWFGYTWVMFGLDLKKIDSFICYRDDSPYGFNDTRINDDIVLTTKLEYTPNYIREIYTKVLTSVDIPEIVEDFRTHTIGIFDEKNIDMLIPCKKYRTISYRISLEVSYPENITKDTRSSIINFTDSIYDEAIKALNRKNSRSSTLTPVERFDASFNNISSTLQLITDKFINNLNRTLSDSELSKDIAIKILYEKVPSGWSNQY